CSHNGEFERARRLLEFVIENYDVDRRFAYGRINDPLVHALAWMSWIHSTTGRLDLAREHSRRAVAHATRIAEPFALSQALSVGALAFAEAGDVEETLSMCRRCVELCEAQNMPNWRVWAVVHEGVALSVAGNHERARNCFALSIELMAAAANLNNIGFLYARWARELAMLGDFAEARHVHAIGHSECLATGQHLMLNELNLAHGMVELLDPASDAASKEQRLSFALSGARESGMRLVELRAAVALAGFWKSRGRGEAGDALILSTLDRLDQVGDCADVRAARAAIEESASTVSK
ncbi:MAG: hypothetical protein Q7T55_14125, partial [Solirubrobacteraceae bacterium]|nr:hypothetical protein [Solirubrobacteraceae bacterium]